MLKTTQVNYAEATNIGNSDVSKQLDKPVFSKTYMGGTRSGSAGEKEYKPTMKTAVAESIDSFLGVESDGGWKWYHYAILIAVLVLLSWGGWYLYKKFKG